MRYVNTNLSNSIVYRMGQRRAHHTPDQCHPLGALTNEGPVDTSVSEYSTNVIFLEEKEPWSSWGPFRI